MKKFALLVGVEACEDPAIAPFPFARADVLSLEGRLGGRCGFDEVRVLCGESGEKNPTRVRIEDALRALAEKIGPDDLFLFFYAGHGVEADGRSFLLTRDSRWDSPAEERLSLESLRQMLSRLKAGRRALLFDAFRRDPRAAAQGADNPMGLIFSRDLRALLRAPPGAHGVADMLSACRPGQRSRDWPEKGHGVFAHFLLEGLDGAAWAEGRIEFHRLSNFTAREVRRWCAATPGLLTPQEPWYEEQGSAEAVVLAEETRRGAAGPAPAAAPLPVSGSPNQEVSENEQRETGNRLLDARRRRLMGLGKLFLEKKLTSDLHRLGKQLFEKTEPDLEARDAERLALFIDMLEGRLAPEKLPIALDAIEAPPAPAPAPIPVPREESGPVEKLLAEARANDSREKGRIALARLEEVLRLVPDHAEARELGLKIRAYFPPAPADLFVNSIGMRMAFIPPGSFLMGSPEVEEGRQDGEGLHQVRLTRGFHLAVTPVSQAQWKAVMGRTPSCMKGDDLPVENVSWAEAANFCETLSRTEGKNYRLPTEAEWEYACRAGTTGPFARAGPLDELAWTDGNSGGKTHPVGQKAPNAWGLFDMHGDVWEWCADWHAPYPREEIVDPKGPPSGTARALRGGSWSSRPPYARSASRFKLTPTYRNAGVGFRPAMDPAG